MEKVIKLSKLLINITSIKKWRAYSETNFLKVIECIKIIRKKNRKKGQSCNICTF